MSSNTEDAQEEIICSKARCYKTNNEFQTKSDSADPSRTIFEEALPH